jgi:hypothetical protein
VLGEKESPEGYARGLGARGYVCVCNAYRLASPPAGRPELVADPGRYAAEEGTWPAMIHDCKACVRWMRANAAELGISPDHIAVSWPRALAPFVRMRPRMFSVYNQ